MFDTIKKNKLFTIIVYSIDIVIAVFCFTLFKDILNDITNVYILISILILLPLITSFIFTLVFDKKVQKYYLTIGNTIGVDVAEAYKFGQIGLAIFDENKKFVWCSGLFEDRQIKLIGTNVSTRFPNLLNLINHDDPNNEKTEIIYINKRCYQVSYVKHLNLFIFKDNTDFDLLSKQYNSDKMVAAMLLIDDIDSVGDIINTNEYDLILKKIDNTITDWSKENGFYIIKQKEDLYLLIGNESNYRKAKENNFDILEKVKTLDLTNVMVTVSLGFSKETNDINKLIDLAKESLNFAESRGGNQVVVNSYEKGLEFFGGSGKEINKNTNTAKLRIMSKSFVSHISNSKKVYLLPHIEADFDAIGSCVSLWYFASRLNVKAYIIGDDKQFELKTRIMFNDLFNDEDILLSPSKALNELDDDTLVIVCDVSNPNIVTAPKVLENARKVAIIDHHRESEINVDNPMFILRDVNASSTCEILSLLLEEIGGTTNIPSRVSSFALAGILLDTNKLSTKTTPSTFKACMYLQQCNADMDLAKSYMKDEYEEYELKAKVLSNIESPLYGYAISSCPEDIIVEKATLAKIATEAIDIKDIKASFVIGYLSKNEVGISARSDGSINVQSLMEKMGGGGHHSSSAAQFKNTTIIEIKNKLISYIKLYYDEL